MILANYRIFLYVVDELCAEELFSNPSFLLRIQKSPLSLLPFENCRRVIP